MPIDKDNTKKYLEIAGQKVHAGLVKATLLVERDAKLLTPVDTGTLRRSITHEFHGKHKAVVGSNVEYAPHVEMGTSKWNGKPFLRPALHKNLRKIKKLLGGD